MRRVQRVSLWIGMTILVSALGGSEAVAGSRTVMGVDLGVASPIRKFSDRASTGGVFSPYVGYMFNDIIGIMGQAQAVGFPVRNAQGLQDNDTWAVGAHAGPRLALPVIGEGSELYATWQGGVFTGLKAHTPISRTSWGFSTGGGLNVSITKSLLGGAFVRYNWLDQRIGDESVRFFTAGVGLMYNIGSPPE